MSREKIIFIFVSELRLTRVPIELSKLFNQDQVVLGHENASLSSQPLPFLLQKKHLYQLEMCNSKL